MFIYVGQQKNNHGKIEKDAAEGSAKGGGKDNKRRKI